jgi:hypothetical protein
MQRIRAVGSGVCMHATRRETATAGGLWSLSRTLPQDQARDGVPWEGGSRGVTGRDMLLDEAPNHTNQDAP